MTSEKAVKKAVKNTAKKAAKKTVKKAVKKTVKKAAIPALIEESPADQRSALSFNGDGMDLFALMIKNMFLTMFTFGIYSFWAKIDIQKFMNRHTDYRSEPFDFHGTGWEKFVGFLKGMLIVSVIFAVVVAVTYGLTEYAGEEIAAVIQSVIMLVLFVAVSPMIIVGKRRYFMSRSSWRGVRFLFAGRWKDLAKIIFRDGFLSVITLGIYAPWFLYHYQTFIYNHSSFGTVKFRFEGDKKAFVKLCFKGVLLSVLTLGIYSFWFRAEMERFMWNNTSLQDRKMSCDLTGFLLFKTAVINILLIICTFGLGSAWALVRMYRVTLGSIGIIGELDFETIKASFDEKASALADGVADASDALDSLADLIS